MKLKFISPAKQTPVYRASVHRTGRIGFTIETAKEFGITIDKSMGIAVNEDDPNDTAIYGMLHDKGKPDTYKIMKGGNYHSVNARSFFDTVGIDYSKGDIYYNVSGIDIDGIKVLKFSIRNVEKISKIETELKKNDTIGESESEKNGK
ncbi:MAG: hypothetical protein JJE22_17085 [Bacteroidia bacterium]|nr:hypothetical protein [Bacteroidia bacterium]